MDGVKYMTILKEKLTQRFTKYFSGNTEYIYFWIFIHKMVWQPWISFSLFYKYVKFDVASSHNIQIKHKV